VAQHWKASWRLAWGEEAAAGHHVLATPEKTSGPSSAYSVLTGSGSVTAVSGTVRMGNQLLGRSGLCERCWAHREASSVAAFDVLAALAGLGDDL
jgi:hypothetical protein